MRQPMVGLTVRQAALIRYAVFAALTIGVLVKYLPADRGNQEPAMTEIERCVGVPVMILSEPGSTTLFGSTIDASPPLEGSLRGYLPLLEAELNAYSSGMLEKSGLRKVVLCRGLALNGHRVGGIPDLRRGTLYLEVIDDPAHKDYARDAVHHEHFHLIDFYDDGLLYADRPWEMLNARGIEYGDGGHHLQDDPTACLPDDSVPGFLNKYSRSGVEEDKAEIFAHMMAQPRVLDARMENDTILLSKYLEMRRRLKEYCPEMNEAFWAGLRDRVRP